MNRVPSVNRAAFLRSIFSSLDKVLSRPSEPSREELRREMSGKSHEELDAILTNRSAYTIDAIDMADRELSQRGLTVPAMSRDGTGAPKAPAISYADTIPYVGEGDSNILYALGKIVLGALVLIAAYWGLNENGWIPHTATVDLFMASNWIVGENQTCLGMHNAPPPNAGQITTLVCPDTADTSSKPHNVSVTFWGKIVRENQDDPSQPVLGTLHHWKCRRDPAGFSCWALD